MVEYRNALAEGTLLGDYKIEKTLGQGTFGITYLGRDTSLDTKVAIKEYFHSQISFREDGTTVLPQSNSDQGDFDWGLDRFLEEAKVLAQFSGHPNIVRVLRYFAMNGTGYIVMDYVEGTMFKDAFEQVGTVPEQDLKKILIPVLQGLESVHNANILHRDIKPDNIILRKDGVPVLIDFGAARPASPETDRSMTNIHALGYSSNEQMAGAKFQGPWSDVYSIGAVAYKAITGNRPIPSNQRAIHDEMLAAVEAGKSEYTQAFLEAVDKALEVNYTERFQSAREFREAIEASDPIVEPNAGVTSSETASSTGTDKKSKVGVFVAIGAAVAAGAAAYVILPTLTPDQQATDRSYANAVSEGTVEAYQSFIQQYSDVPCYLCDETRLKHIDALIEQAAANVDTLKKQALDNSAWDAADKTGTLKGYEDYLGQYPFGQHATKAQRAVNRLKALAQLQANPTEELFERVGKQHPAVLEDAEYKAVGELLKKRAEEALAREVAKASRDFDAAATSDTSRSYQTFLSRYSGTNTEQIAALAKQARDRVQDLREFERQPALLTIVSRNWRVVPFIEREFSDVGRQIRSQIGTYFDDIVKIRSLPLRFLESDAELTEVDVRLSDGRFGKFIIVRNASAFDILDGDPVTLRRVVNKHRLAIDNSAEAQEFVQFWLNNLTTKSGIVWALTSPDQVPISPTASAAVRSSVNRQALFRPTSARVRDNGDWSITVRAVLKDKVYDLKGFIDVSKKQVTFDNTGFKQATNQPNPNTLGKVVFERSVRVVR